MHQNYFPSVFLCQVEIKNWGNWIEFRGKRETKLCVDTHLNSKTAKKEAKAEMRWSRYSSVYWVTIEHQVLHIQGFSYLKSYNMRKIQQSPGYPIHPTVGFTIGRTPIMPSIWAPNGNVKINIITVVELGGSKQRRKMHQKGKVNVWKQW